MSNSFTFHFYISAHFCDEVLTDAKSQACSLLVTISVSHHAELNEEFVNVFRRYTSAAIFNDDLKGNKEK
jgi:hypothetical protein